MSTSATEAPVQPASTVTNTPGGILVGADQPVTSPPTFTVVPNSTATNQIAGVAGQTFTAEQIAKAREDEKNKLYPELQSMKAELAELKKERDDKIKAEQKARKEAEDALKAQQEADTDTRTLLEQKEAEWNLRFQTLQTEREQERALLDMERQYQELQAYRLQATAAAADNIVPELLDLVSGTSREEIDASIAGLAERSARIIEQMQQAAQATRAGMRGAPVTAPPAGPLDTYSGHDPALEAASNGSLSFEDYVKNRDKLLSSTAQLRSRGLYG